MEIPFSEITVAETLMFNEGFFDPDRGALMVRVRAATRQEKIAYMRTEKGRF